MKFVSMNMLFWDDCLDGKTRHSNVNFCWPKLKELNAFLQESGIDSEAKLFDFSHEKQISDAIHIPYPPKTFEKSKKINEILSQISAKFCMIFDCDVFYDNQDYNLLLEQIRNLQPGDIITFDSGKLSGNPNEYINGLNFDREKADWRYAYSGAKENGPLHHHCGGLGGSYIVDCNLLNHTNGFDEKFKGWGAEDGDALDKIMNSGKKYQLKPTKNFASFHLPHEVDMANPLYANRF